MSSMRYDAANLLGDHEALPRLHGRVVAHEAGREPRTPARPRKSACAPTAAFEKARVASDKAQSQMMSQTEMRANAKKRSLELAASHSTVTTLTNAAAAASADVLALKKEVQDLKREKNEAQNNLKTATANNTSDAVTHEAALKVQSLEDALVAAAAAAVEKRAEWEKTAALDAEVKAGLLADTRKESIRASERTEAMQIEKHELALESMSATRELEATAAQRREEQFLAMQEAAVKAAEVDGENKGTQQLLEFQGNELKRQRVERENDMRRNEQAAEAYRAEQRARDLATAAAASVATAERLSLAAMSTPRYHPQQQQQQPSAQVEQWQQPPQSWVRPQQSPQYQQQVQWRGQDEFAQQ